MINSYIFWLFYSYNAGYEESFYFGCIEICANLVCRVVFLEEYFYWQAKDNYSSLFKEFENVTTIYHEYIKEKKKKNQDGCERVRRWHCLRVGHQRRVLC